MIPSSSNVIKIFSCHIQKPKVRFLDQVFDIGNKISLLTKLFKERNRDFVLQFFFSIFIEN